MNLFNDYIKAFKAEWLKLRNSGVFWLVLIMAAFIPVIFTLVGLFANEDGMTSIAKENAWTSLFRGNFQGFGIFFYPIFLTLVVIRLTQMEHRGGGWKLIEVQPISKLSLYLGKFSVAVVVSFLCIFALVLYILLSGTIIMLARPASDLSKFSIPFDFISRLGLRMLISGLGVLGIQFLFSVVISGFIGPFAIGLAGTIAGTIFLGFQKLLWWPYIAPAQTVMNPDGSQAGNLLMFYEWLSIAWMLIALWLGYQWYQRKTFKRAYFKPIGRVLYVLIPAALFAVFFIYINKPVQLSSHDRTLIAGTVEAKNKITRVYVISEPLMDTVLEIPVTNNSFRFHTDKKIPAAIYLFKAGNLEPQQVFFGSNDSLFIRLKTDGRSTRFTITGNRLPENEFLDNGFRAHDGYTTYYLQNYGYELKPGAFAKQVVNLWKSDMDRIDEYKTADNLKPAADFITLQKKLNSLYYLKLLDSRYAQWYRVYHPNETLEYPKSVDAIRNTVNYADSTLLSYEQYRDNIAEYYQQKHKLSLSNDTAYITKLCAVLPAGKVRDYLVYNKLKEAIGRTRDSTNREALLTQFLPTISQQNVQYQLWAQHLLLKSLNRGKPAPDFATIALNKDTFSLKNFKGRYVVIDVWATWCGPCRVQSPNFERIAEQYTNPGLAFVALSVDDDKWAWQNEASEKSSRVLQLHLEDKNLFRTAYGIEYIPRYIFIDPEGKIINAQMPEPGNASFEDILRKEIPGLAHL